ncbi:hypothetical protein GPB2148_3080 [marine gamma proteobacterium HTCC2148]|nr:hypothetical protein GPB2148_3080 [marine gamma proteobacterium HTCC2148]
MTGVADLEKFALIDPKTLFTVFGMPILHQGLLASPFSSLANVRLADPSNREK